MERIKREIEYTDIFFQDIANIEDRSVAKRV